MAQQKTEIVPLFGEVVVGHARQDFQRPGEVERMRLWQEAFEVWMDGLRTANTRRAYRMAWNDLFAFTGKLPWAIRKTDVEKWVTDMRGRGLSDCTLQQRLAGISSFYIFVINDFSVTNPDGSETALIEINPAAGKRIRPKITPYGKATYLGPDEVRSLLRAIKRVTVQGLRDYAMFLCYLSTGRRNSEIRMLKWGDFSKAGNRINYRWSGKGTKDAKNELPGRAYEAILAYLKAAGRLETMLDDEYIFTALTNRATRLPTVNTAAFNPRNQALSMREVGRLLKRYAKKAGLDPKKIHVHTLRHTAAMLRKEGGGYDVKKLQEFLGHSSSAITDIYLHRVEGQVDDGWTKVEDYLGLWKVEE